MLIDVLREINNSDHISKISIATKLNKSQDLIEDAFYQLNRMGYIREESSTDNCNLKCGNCPYAASCSGIPIKSIEITEKGERLLQKQSS